MSTSFSYLIDIVFYTRRCELSDTVRTETSLLADFHYSADKYRDDVEAMPILPVVRLSFSSPTSPYDSLPTIDKAEFGCPQFGMKSRTIRSSSRIRDYRIRDS